MVTYDTRTAPQIAASKTRVINDQIDRLLTHVLVSPPKVEHAGLMFGDTEVKLRGTPRFEQKLYQVFENIEKSDKLPRTRNVELFSFCDMEVLNWPDTLRPSKLVPVSWQFDVVADRKYPMKLTIAASLVEMAIHEAFERIAVEQNTSRKAPMDWEEEYECPLLKCEVHPLWPHYTPSREIDSPDAGTWATYGHTLKVEGYFKFVGCAAWFHSTSLSF